MGECPMKITDRAVSWSNSEVNGVQLDRASTSVFEIRAKLLEPPSHVLPWTRGRARARAIYGTVQYKILKCTSVLMQ